MKVVGGCVCPIQNANRYVPCGPKSRGELKRNESWIFVSRITTVIATLVVGTLSVNTLYFTVLCSVCK